MLIAVALMTASCSKDNDDPEEEKDTTKPQITLNTPPQNEANLNAGEAIEFSANFMDDKELSGYKIDIHFNDGHEHKSVNDDGKWSFQKKLHF